MIQDEIAWHDCDGKIGEHLRRAVEPSEEFNNGKPTWFMVVIYEAARKLLPVDYCPVCGERLPRIND